MKAVLRIVWTFTWLACISAAWGGTAQIQLSNNSIRMLPGPCSCGFGLIWKLHFSSVFTEDPLRANGELVPRPAGMPTTHWAYMLLEDPSMYSSTTYAEIDLPIGNDLNGNGVDDFFETGREVGTSSSGTYESSLGGGTLTLSWSRAAGSTMGNCTLYMHDAMLGLIGPFNHQFEIIQLGGSLAYTRTADSSSGTMVLQQSGSSAWEGPVQLTRGTSDPTNSLTLQAGAWTNGTDTLSFEETILTRDPSRPTGYRGTLKTSAEGFSTWTMWIIDPTDSNGNGIPDLSDELVPPPPRSPALSLRKTGARLELLISGDTGRSHEIQTSTSLTSSSWDLVTSLVLTNDPQAVEISPPSNGPRFWRVQAK